MAGQVLGSAHLACESTLEDVAEALRPVFGLPFPEAQIDMFVGDQMVQGLQQAESCPQFIVSAGCPDSDEEARFMQVFQHLTLTAEEWNFFNLAYLQHFDPGMRTLKHAVCKSWLEVARSAAKQRVQLDPGPLFVLRRNVRGAIIKVDLFSADGSYPDSVDRNLQDSMQVNTITCVRELADAMLLLASLEWDPNIEEISSDVMREAYGLKGTHVALEPQPTTQDVVRLAHAQVLLSSKLGVVEVQGSLPTNLVQYVASLLRWHLRVVRFEASDRIANTEEFGAAVAHHTNVAMQEAFQKQQHSRGASGLCTVLQGLNQLAVAQHVNRKS